MGVQLERPVAKNRMGVGGNGALFGSCAGTAGEYHQPDYRGQVGRAGLVADERNSAAQPVFRRSKLRHMPQQDSRIPALDAHVSCRRPRHTV